MRHVCIDALQECFGGHGPRIRLKVCSASAPSASPTITNMRHVMTFSLRRCIVTRLRIPLNWLQEGRQIAALHLTASQLLHCCSRTAADLYSSCCSTPYHNHVHTLHRASCADFACNRPANIRINRGAQGCSKRRLQWVTVAPRRRISRTKFLEHSV